MNNRKKIILQIIFKRRSMKKIFFNLLIITILIISGCAKKEIKKHIKTNQDTLSINFFNKYKTLFPPAINDRVSSQIVSQLYDGLVVYNPKNLKIQPAIAKSWEKNKTETIFTFHLNTNVYFDAHKEFNNQPLQLTMEDILFSFQYLCTNLPENKNFFTLMYKIKGAKEYFDTHSTLSEKFDIDGIREINDSTLQIEIEDKNFPLLDILALPSSFIFSIESIGNCLS